MKKKQKPTKKRKANKAVLVTDPPRVGLVYGIYGPSGQ